MPNSDKQSNSCDSQSPTYLGSEEQIAARLTVRVDKNIISPKHEDASQKEDREPLKTIGEFTLIREIGRGGMGVVYEATQASLDRRVALKTLPVSGRMDQRQIQRFQNEARAAAQLQHPNIVPVFSIGTEAGIHYYAMQLIPGHDLAHFIRHAKTLLESPRAPRSGDTPKFAHGTTAQVFQPTPRVSRTGTDSAVAEGSTLSVPLSGFIDMMADHKSSVADRKNFESILQIGIQAAGALHHAHQLGIVHRDIKPSNLMLDQDGKLWVTDFGLAQIQGAGALTMTGEVIGTLRYMSPEQPLGQRVLVDQRTDIYSLGVTLYELLTFKKAFGGDSPKEIIRQVCFDEPVSIRRLNPRVPEDLETIVSKAMSKNPDDRYQSAQELADDLERFRTDQPISARRPTLLHQGRRWMRRHVALATAVAVGIVFLLLTSLTATGMIWNSLPAETLQRRRAESLLDKSEGLRLIANSTLMKEENPGLALLLAVRGAELNPGVDANTALLNAMGNNHEMRAFSPRKELTETLCVSPDGTRVITTVQKSLFGRGNFPAIESDLRTGEPIKTFDDGIAITSASYSPNGKLLLITSAPLRTPGRPSRANGDEKNAVEHVGVATLWDSRNGVKKVSFNDSSLDTTSEAQFSPDSSRLVLPCSDHSVRVYSTVSGQLELSLKGHTKKLLSTAFSKDGQRLVSVSEDNTIRVWDATSGVEVRNLTLQTDFKRIPTVAFAAENQLVISSAEGTQLVSLETGKRSKPEHWADTASMVSHDGDQIVFYSKFGRQVSIRDSHSQQMVSHFGTEDAIVATDWSADGKSLMVATTVGVYMHRAEDGTRTAMLLGHSDRLINAALTPDSSQVVTTSFDKTVRVWSVASGNEALTLLDQPARIAPSSWCVSSDSKYVAVAEKPIWNCEVLDADGLSQASQFPGRASRDGIDADRLVTIMDHEVHLWHSASSRKVAAFQIATDTVQSARTVPGTDVLVILLQSGKVLLWDSVTQQRRTLSDTTDYIYNFDIHPDNGNVLLPMKSGRALVLNAVSGAIVQTLNHDDAVLAARFSPSGSQILTVDSRNTTRIWVDGQPTPVRTLVPANGGRCDQAAFSADEKVVVTWNELEKDMVRCWSLETGELVRETTSIGFPSVVLHPSEPLAAIASSSDGLFVWNWLTGEQQQFTQSPSESPGFHEDRLVAIESVPGFLKGTGRLMGFQGLSEFIRSTITIRAVKTGEVLSRRSLEAEPWSLKVSPVSGKMLLSTRSYNAAVVRMDDHQRIVTLGKHSGPTVFLFFLGKPERVVCASIDGNCTVWDLSGRLLHRLEGHQHPLVRADVSQDGLRLATFDAAGLGRLWNLQDGAQIMEIPGHTNAVHTVQFSASGKSLVTASLASGVRIWDLISRAEETIAVEGDALYTELSPDEVQMLIVTGKAPINTENKSTQLPGARAFLLNRQTGEKKQLLMNGTPRSGCFSLNGKHLVLLSREYSAAMFDTADGHVVEAFNPNRRPIYDVAFSQDGRSLLARHDNELSMWSLDDHKELLRTPDMNPNDYRSSLQTLQHWKPFSADGKWIFSVDETLQKWPCDPLTEAIRRTPRPMTESEIARFSVNLLVRGEQH